MKSHSDFKEKFLAAGPSHDFQWALSRLSRSGRDAVARRSWSEGSYLIVIREWIYFYVPERESFVRWVPTQQDLLAHDWTEIS